MLLAKTENNVGAGVFNERGCPRIIHNQDDYGHTITIIFEVTH